LTGKNYKLIIISIKDSETSNTDFCLVIEKPL